jgi:hypothetical protein
MLVSQDEISAMRFHSVKEAYEWRAEEKLARKQRQSSRGRDQSRGRDHRVMEDTKHLEGKKERPTPLNKEPEKEIIPKVRDIMEEDMVEVLQAHVSNVE